MSFGPKDPLLGVSFENPPKLIGNYCGDM